MQVRFLAEDREDYYVVVSVPEAIIPSTAVSEASRWRRFGSSRRTVRTTM